MNKDTVKSQMIVKEQKITISKDGENVTIDDKIGNIRDYTDLDNKTNMLDIIR